MSNDYAIYIRDYAWVIGAISVVLLYLINWYRRPKQFPPGPRGLPLVGYLPYMGGSPEKTIYNLSEKFGKIFSLRLGGEDAVFLNDYDSINKAFAKNGDKISGRRPFAHLEALKQDNGIASLDYGPKWKSQRKFGLMTLRGFGVGKKQMENICLEELHYLNEEIREHNGKSFDMSHLLHSAIANNICGVTLGQRFDYDDKKYAQILNNLIDHSSGGKLIPFVNLLIIFVPVLQHIPPISFVHKRFLKTAQGLIDWLDGIVKEHETTFDENNIRDFIDAFIVEKRKGQDDSFKDVQLLHYIADLFVAGTETTSSTLYWSLLCMLHHPEAQRKLREEILKVVGSSGTVTMAQKSDMPYTNAFMQEMLRFRTLLPLSVPHKSNEDTEINGYVIPQGTQVISNLWAVHNDPNLWKNPEKFHPERFLDEKGNFINSNHVIPFSVGPRHCLGEQLARMEFFIFLVGIVQKFEFLPDPNADQLPNIKDGTLGLAYIPKPYSIVAKEL